MCRSVNQSSSGDSRSKTHDPVLVDQWDHELGAGLRHQAHVAGVLAHVGHEDRLLAPDRSPAETLVHGQAALLLARTEVHGLAQDELLVVLVQKQDPEHLVVDDALHELGDPLQQLVEVEDRGGLLADLVERGQQTRVPAGLPIEVRILDGHGQVAGQDPQGRPRPRGEGLRVGSFDVQDADEAVLVDERDGELGHHPWEGRHVLRVLRDVGHEDRLAAHRRRARDPLSQPNPVSNRRVEVVAFDEGGHENVLLVGEHDLEDFVVHDATDTPRDRRIQLLRIEDPADLADDAEQLGQQLSGKRGARLGSVGIGHPAC